LAPWAAQKQRKLNLFVIALLQGLREVQRLSMTVPTIKGCNSIDIYWLRQAQLLLLFMLLISLILIF
jgi:hypothetical protein